MYNSAAPTLSVLPDELSTNILRYSDHLSLLACRLTCHKFNQVIQSSAELQYILELGMDGMIDCAALSIPYPDRLATLMRRRNAWAAMEWSDASTSIQFPWPGECLAYELVAGVLAKLTETYKFIYAEIPSRAAAAGQSDDICIETWNLPFPARDFAIDPTQDVVIFLEDTRIPVASTEPRNTHLYIYCMSTRRPHPLAQEPRIVINGPQTSYLHPFIGVGLPYIMFALIQIAEDALLMQYATNTGSVHIRLWNWMTGDLWVDEDHRMTCAGCGLLSPRALILASTQGMGSIGIYALEFSDSDDRRIPHLKLKATILLPSIAPGNSLRYVYTHSSPFVARPSQSKMASPSPESYIHVMSIGYDGQFDRAFRLYVSNRTLLSYAAAPPGDAPMLVPWKTWGPENTRFMEQMETSNWLRFVHGTRFVGPPLSRTSPFEAARPASETVLQLYDFNPYCRRLHASVQPVNGAEADLHTEPTVVEGQTFTEAITTRLPYRQILCTFDKRYTSFLIDDERLFALEYDPREGGGLNNVDVYTF